MRLAIAILIISAALASHAADVRVIERAEMIPAWWIYGIHDDDTDVVWTPVTLPHNWYRSHPPQPTSAWYRITLPLEHVVFDQSLYLPRLPVVDLSVYVNKQLIWRLSQHFSAGTTISGVLIPIPPYLLAAGNNMINLEVRGYGSSFHGVPRIYFGKTRVLSQRAALRNLLQGQMIHMAALALGAIGALSLLLWMRTGRDPVLFWYAISGLALFASTALWFPTLWREDLGPWRSALIFLRFNGYLLPLMILHLRLSGRRVPLLEGALWLMLLAAVGDLAFPRLWDGPSWYAWVAIFGALPAVFVVALLCERRLLREPTVILLIVADVAAVLFNLHDVALRYGWIDFDRPMLIYYVAPFVMLAAGAPILQRLLAGVDATRRMNVELEARVAAKTREIEASHAQLRQAEHDQALAGERRRIMADMHDGLGARLVGLLSAVQSGRAHVRELGEGIAAALDDLRLAIDSLEPVEGDVGVVLANVRHRMRPVLERAGVRFLWSVSELPRMDDLTPARILAIQRILLEVFTNAIKHSAAGTVAVFTARVPRAVQIVIEDDGRGFVPGELGTGHGLHNLELRAKQAGGTLVVESKPAKGTRVILSLPVNGDTSGEGEPAYPVRGISTAPSSA